MHTCDNWVIIKLNSDDPHYRVLTGTSGGYVSGDGWRMNSGITGVTEDEHYFYFSGASGSVYQCHKKAYCLRMNNAHVWKQMQDMNEKKGFEMFEKLDEDTDWMSVDWIIS